MPGTFNIQPYLPEFLYSAPDWLLKDLPGGGLEKYLLSLSLGDDTWGTETIAAADIPDHGWLIYDNLTINGTVKWATPVLRVLVLGTLLVDTGGLMSGGANNGGNGQYGVGTGAGGNGMVGNGGDARTTPDQLGQDGTLGAGSSGGYGATTSKAGGDRITLAAPIFPSFVGTEFNFYATTTAGYESVTNITTKQGGAGGTGVGNSTYTGLGGGGGSVGMSLVLAAKTCTINGSGIVLTGGNGGNGGVQNAAVRGDGGGGGDGGNLIILSQSAANGTRTVSGGAGGTGTGASAQNGIAGSAGENIWITLE